MWAFVVVAVEPDADCCAQLIDVVPVARPDQLDLERLDESLGNGVARGPTHGSEGLLKMPVPAQFLAICAGVLRPVVGPQLQAVGYSAWHTEAVAQRARQRRENRR